MRYLKLYEQFRLNESSDWKETLEINGKEYKINWGMPKLELAEIFQTLNHHKSNLPKEWSDSFGVIFNSPRPEEFTHQTDPSAEFINKPLEASMRGKATPTNPEIKYSCYELLQLDSIGGKSGDDLVPYQNFIKEINKAFWNGKKVQLDEPKLQQLAKNKASEPGDDATGFHKVMLDSEFLDKFKIYYDIYVQTDLNPDGIVPPKSIGVETGWIPKLRNDLLPNMKEPKDQKHNKLWKELREHDLNPDKSTNADWKDQDSAQIIWNKLVNYKGYFGDSFDFFTDNIEKGGLMPLSAAVDMSGQLFLTGGNRRMTFYCGKKILPTIWVW
jgi:hypothetical protein